MRGPKGRRTRPKGLRAGDRVLGEGQPAPPHQLGGLGNVVSSPSWGRGGYPRPLSVFAVGFRHQIIQIAFLTFQCPSRQINSGKMSKERRRQRASISGVTAY